MPTNLLSPQHNYRHPSIRLLVLCALGLWLVGVLAGCAECRYDTDCAYDAYCERGRCLTGRKVPPPRRPISTASCLADGESRACYTGPANTLSTGACRGGRQVCVGGSWGACQQQVVPSAEVCDGKDNDCNGQIDETFPTLGQPCQTELKGPCLTGKTVCDTGTKRCVSPHKPSAEICDGKDNDCDGTVDQGCSCTTGKTQACGSDKGECKVGTQVCESGKWAKCTGALGPSVEACDGVDNDCDGTIDNGCDCQNGKTQPCGSDKGECTKGTQTCSSGKWGVCAGEEVPKAEACDGKDNDCDGTIDEGCDCRDGQTRPCGLDTGVCRKGIELCKSGRWAGCAGQIGPGSESCNGKDDDCDGRVDESVSCGANEKCQSGRCVLVCNPPHSKPISGQCVLSCGQAAGSTARCQTSACTSGYKTYRSWDCRYCCGR